MAKIKEAIEDFKPDPRLVDERGATAERLRRAGGEYSVSDTGSATLNNMPVERMKLRGVITGEQYLGLIEFRRHWYYAGMAGTIGSSDMNKIFQNNIGSFGLCNTETQVTHLQEYQKATARLGPKAWVVEKVVCQEVPLEDVGRRMGWANRPQAVAVATEAVKDGADILCEIWGYS